MFLRLNFMLAVCLLSLKIRFASTSYPYPPYDSCGQTSFTAASGVVRYSERSGIFRGCSYRIAVGQNNSASIRFLSLNLQTTGGPCSRKWITLMCSLDQTKEAITKSSSEICHAGQWNSSLRVDDCPVLFVILHRPNSESTIDLDMPIPDFHFSPYPMQSRTPPGWFQLRYEIQSTPTSSPINVTERPEIDCGQTLFRNRSGVIVLPRRTDVPLARINCTYTIEAAPRLTPLRAGVQRSISLNISHFDLLTLTDSLDACDQDRLQIECTDLGGERRTVWGCAQHFQPKYRDCVRLEMILRSDNYDPSPTRRIPYYRKPGDTADEIEEDEEEDDDADDRSNIGCGNTVFTASSGNVTSPGFPLSHPHSIHCIYRIETDPEKVISLNIRNFNLEFSSGCSYDWLKISCALGEMNKTRKFCGVIQVTSSIRYSDCSSVWLMFYADSSISRGGFRIEYSTSPRETTTTDDEVVCGVTDFRANTGTVTLPSNPSGFMKTINCTYNIYASDANFIFLDLTSINLTDIAYSIASCNIENFMIACVNGTESWRFDLCLHRNHWSPQPSFSNCQQVQMRLYSKYFDFQTVHEIPYKIISTDEICGNTRFTASAGVISSPNFPQMYPSNVNCTYSISGTILSKISVSISTFYMGDQRTAFTSQGCKDWILMTCQSSNYVSPYAGRRFCGPLTWPPVVQFFNCSTLLLQFSSGPAAPGLDINRFSLNYTVSNSVRPSDSITEILPEVDCGDLHFTAESSRVILPHNASLPLASLNCTFTASGSRKGLISIILQELFHIPDVSSSICSQDHITITCVSDKATAYIGSSKYLRYCWEAFSGMSANYTDCDTIRFSLLHSTYSPLQPRVLGYSITSTDCGVTEFSNSTGNVKSPRYPGPYLHNMHCVYTIEAGPNKTVSLQSLDLRIEGGGGSPLHGHNGCPHDWLIIRCTGGGTERISETVEPTPLFPDDYFEGDEDFLYYETARLREMYHRDRMISMSPFSSYLDRRLCGTDAISTTLMNCETITLEFHTDVSVAYQGFNIQYNRTISNTTTANAGRSGYICENQTFTEPVGMINSPNFTDRIDCTYVIETGESHSVILEFLSVSSSAPYSSFRRYLGECQNTWLKISCFPGSMAARNPLQDRRICTTPDSGSAMLSGCRRVSIQFYSTVAAEFSIRYTVTEGLCRNSNFTNSTGSITSPGYPLLYPDNLDCTYFIEVGANNWLSLRFRHFNLEGSTSLGHPGTTLCNYDFLKMTCDSGEPGARSALLSLGDGICGLRMPFSASLTGCKRAAFRFVTDSSHERDGFKIQYRILKDGENECGNRNFSNASGVISSPGFPSPYPDNVNCTYFIEIRGQRSFVLLDFQSFAVFMLGRHYPRDTSCETSDSFQVRCVLGDAVDPSDSLNKKMCGPKAPFKVSVTGCQRLALDFYAYANVADGGTGFYINYTTFNPDDVCGRTLFNKPSGIIGLPDPSTKYITTFNCSYSVYVGNHSFVAFDIRSFTKTTDEKKSLSQDWLLIFCRGEKLNESHKITHKSGSQILRKFSNCSVVDIIFHNENEASERFFSISYFLGFHADVPKTASLSGSNRVGVGFGVFFVILIVVALIAVTVVWWRKHRPSLPWQKLEDDRPFVPDDDAEAEQSESGITTTEDGFSFSVHQPDKASCKKYISLNSLS